MNYKVSILAMAISAGLSTGAFAGDWSNSGVVVNNNVTSPSINLVAVDGTGAPVDTNQINPDGTFKAGCAGCAWVDPTTLTQAQRDAIAADPNAAVFDSKTSKIITVKTDTYTGDSHAVARTIAGVKTGEAYGDSAGNGTAIAAGGVASVDANGNATLLTSKGVGSADATGNVSVLTAKGVGATNANGDAAVYTAQGAGVADANGNVTLLTSKGVGAANANGDAAAFTANGVTVINTAGASSSVTAGGASFTDASGGNTTIAGGDVTASGTISGGKVIAGGRDVGKSLTEHDQRLDNHDQQLANHDQRITHVQNQADATDNRLNAFNGSNGSLETWATGVDNWRADTNAWRGGVDNTLARYGSEISALQDWRGVATAQISNLQKRMGKVEGAAALAMTLQVPTLEAGKRFAFSGDFGGANSTGAFTAGAAFRLNDTWQLHAGGGAATNGQAWGGRVGFTGQW